MTKIKRLNVGVYIALYITYRYLRFIFYRFRNSATTTTTTLLVSFLKRNTGNKARSLVKIENSKLMILDDFRIFHWLQINTSLLKEIRKYNQAEICVQVFEFPDHLTRDFYAQWGVEKFLIVHPKLKDLKKMFFHAKEISTKSLIGADVINYEIEKCQIGIDIYESILRRGFATLESNSWVQKRIIVNGVIQYYATRNLFDNNIVKIVAVSHDNYIGPGILSRVAYTCDVVVMLANPLDVTFTTRSFQNYEKFVDYKRYALSIPVSEYVEGTTLAKNELDSRLRGKIDRNMTYQKKSAFSKNVDLQLTRSRSTKILVATHDFFDSPHGYGPMEYYDFMDWLETIAQFADNGPGDLEWYLKCHADASLEQIEIIHAFSSNHPSFKVVNPEASWQQLRDEGLGLVITCYGSVAHELPLLNIEVISCSYNPHVAYDFSISLESKMELRKYLHDYKRVASGGSVSDSKSRQIYEFYFVHNHLTQIDDLFLTSYRDFSQNFSTNWNSDEAKSEIISQSFQIDEKASRIISELLLKNYVRYFESKLMNYNFELLTKRQVESIFNL